MSKNASKYLYLDLIKNARYLLKTEQYKKLEILFDEHLNECYETPYFLIEYGKYLMETLNHDKAIDVFLKLINENSPNKYFAYYNLAKCYRFKNDYDKAIECLNIIINSNHKEKIHAYMLLAKIYVLKRDFKLAESIYKKAKTEENVDSRFKASIQLAKLHNVLAHYDSAYSELHSIDDSVLTDNQKYELALNMIETCFKLYKVQEAEEILNVYMKSIGYKDNDIYFARAQVDILKNRTIQAINNIKKAKSLIKKESRLIQCDKLLVNCYTNVLEYEKAKAILNNIESEEEEHRKTYKNRLFIYEGMGEYEKAINYLKYLLYTDYADSVFVKLKLCCYYIKYKQYEKAKEIIDCLECEYMGTLEYQNFQRAKAYLNKYINANYKLDDGSLCNIIIDSNDKDTAIIHIKEHQKEFDSYLKRKVDLEQMYDYVKSCISDRTCCTVNMVETHLIDFPQDELGINHDIKKIKAVTTVDTRDIITFYPFTLDKVENDIIEEYSSSVPVKRLSQIDKFMKKYSKP